VNEAEFRVLAIWAADCAERALPSFESRHRADERPRRALLAARSLARGEIKAEAAREIAREAERAARESEHPAAVAAARACAEAAYVSRGMSHALSAAAYCRVAVASENPGSTLEAVTRELEFQQSTLPPKLAGIFGNQN
jgi:hypothetical protein